MEIFLRKFKRMNKKKKCFPLSNLCFVVLSDLCSERIKVSNDDVWHHTLAVLIQTIRPSICTHNHPRMLQKPLKHSITVIILLWQRRVEQDKRVERLGKEIISMVE